MEKYECKLNWGHPFVGSNVEQVYNLINDDITRNIFNLVGCLNITWDHEYEMLRYFRDTYIGTYDEICSNSATIKVDKEFLYCEDDYDPIKWKISIYDFMLYLRQYMICKNQKKYVEFYIYAEILP